MSDSKTAGRQSSAGLISRLRLERDRHVAFAFAAADLLVEAAEDGTVVAAAGAAYALLGLSPQALKGRPIADFVAASDRPLLRRLVKQVHARCRIDPTVIRLARGNRPGASILFGGCCLPDRGDGNAFLSLSLLPGALAAPAEARDGHTGLLTLDGLRDAASRLACTEDGVARQLQLVRLDGLAGAARQLPPSQADMLLEEIGAALRASSVGGDAAGRLGENAFGIVSATGNDPQSDTTLLEADLVQAMHEAGIPAGRVAPRVARIELELGGLNGEEVGRALTHAMNRFVRSRDGAIDILTLQDGLVAAVNATVSRFADTRRLMADRRFTLAYQPVVYLGSRVVHHYEALSRFPDGADPYDTIVFSEDVGLIPELDLLVCRLAIDALAGIEDVRIAVNLSGRSVQNEAFRTAMSELLAQLGVGRDRLLFELTESAAIADMAEASAFLTWLRRMGHAVCLDDFGAGAAAYGYLRRFDVDFVKIDGPFLKSACEHGRERALIRSICVLCHELGSNVIGEMIEDEAMLTLAASLGVGYGQGWLFGRPMPELPRPAGPLHRDGLLSVAS